MRRLGRLGRRVGRPSRRLGRWLGGRPRVFLWEFRARQPGGGLGGEPQARSSSFAFFSRFLRRSRRPPPSKRRREAEFNSAKARFFPFVFPFFSARLAGPGAR